MGVLGANPSACTKLSDIRGLTKSPLTVLEIIIQGGIRSYAHSSTVEQCPYKAEAIGSNPIGRTSLMRRGETVSREAHNL